MPEPWPDQELLIHLRERNSNKPPQRPQKHVKKEGAAPSNGKKSR